MPLRLVPSAASEKAAAAFAYQQDWHVTMREGSTFPHLHALVWGSESLRQETGL